jgi:hypothetical protein
MVTQSTIFSIIVSDYRVVIIKPNHKSHMNMVISHFYVWTQWTSLIHIRGYRGDSNQYNITFQGINLATRHTWATKATRVTTFHNDYQKIEPGPPYPSVNFHAKTSIGSLWVAWILSQCHPWSTVECHPTQRPSNLLSLWDPIKYAPIHNSMLVATGPNRRSP